MLTTNEMELINNEQAGIPNNWSLLPSTRQHIPVLWSGNDNLTLLHEPHIRVHITSERHHIDAKLLKATRPVIESLLHECGQRSNVNTAAIRLSREHTKNSQL